jgi:hypothetical protein
MLPEKVVVPTSIGESLTAVPISDPRGWGPQSERAMARLTLWNFPGSLIHLYSSFCPEFALPLSLWLSCGWIGLRLHVQAELDAAGLLWRVMPEEYRSTI